MSDFPLISNFDDADVDPIEVDRVIEALAALIVTTVDAEIRSILEEACENLAELVEALEDEEDTEEPGSDSELSDAA